MTISAKNVNLGYKDSIVVSNASITLRENEITCLIGPNGCGKSTLLRGLSGIIPPHSGVITLDNKDLTLWQRKALARRVAVLPQNPTAPDDISLFQLVSHGRYPYQGFFGRASKADFQAIEWALEVTRIAPLSHRVFNTLSGGERQLGWIALALAQQSDILVLDEQTTFLDMGHQYEVMDLLARLNQEHQLTILMVLHDINQASQYSHRILAMSEGKIIADGSPSNVISKPLISKMFGIQTEIIGRHQAGKPYPYCLPQNSTNSKSSYHGK